MQAHELLIEQRVLRDQHVLRARLQDVLRHRAAEHALAERFHHVATFDQRRHVEAVRRCRNPAR